jgi:hypothetical protein
MLIGLPAAGKSTWRSQFLKTVNCDEWVSISSDDFIESFAKSSGKTYTEVFNDANKLAMEDMEKNIRSAITMGKNMIWDQTNTTAKARVKKMKQIPSSYKIEAVYVVAPDEKEHIRRLNSRPGKIIPDYVINSMRAGFEVPTIEEGFEKVTIVHS